jgi:hypothetical protein
MPQPDLYGIKLKLLTWVLSYRVLEMCEGDVKVLTLCPLSRKVLDPLLELLVCLYGY